MKVLQVLASFSLLVLIHEFGHFLFAKLFKVRVDKFYLFFNPWFSIFKFRIGETEYGMGWVPFGGYCKIAGMVDETSDSEDLKSEPQPWEFRSKPAWQRLLIIVGGVLMNLILAIGIYVGITYKWGESYIKTEDVTEGFYVSELGHEIGFRTGDRVLKIGDEPINNYLTIPNFLFLNDVATAEVLRDGQVMEIPINHARYLTAYLNDSIPVGEKLLFSLRFPFVAGEVLDDYPAALAGMMTGDSLVAVNGVKLKWFDQFVDAFGKQKGDTAWVSVVRSGEELTLPVVVSDEGTIGVRPAELDLRSIYNVSTYQYTLLESIPIGFKRAFTQVGDYLKQLKRIASPENEAYKKVGGIISMGKIFPAQWDWLSFWSITAFLSIMLAVLNILPVPMLDGGHMIFILYEMVTKRKPSDKFMERAQLVGMVIVFAILIWANGGDIVRLFTD